jgi:hypothetical protein
MIKRLSEKTTAYISHSTTIEFLNVAQQFVTLLERDKLNSTELYSSIHKLLVKLYQTGLNLEHVELRFSKEETESDFIPPESFEMMNRNLHSAFGSDGFYWKIFDPTSSSEKEAMQGWLVDDLSDIYAELKEALHKIHVIGTDESIEDAFWHLKFGFNHHWGNHCVDAIRALHYQWYDGKGAM